MSLKHTWSIGVKNDSGSQAVGDVYSVTYDQEENGSVVAVAGQTTHKPLPTLVKADIVSFYVKSDKTITLNINSANSSVQQVSIAPNASFEWNNTMAFANPIVPSSITDFYFVNAGLASANVAWGFGYNI